METIWFVPEQNFVVFGQLNGFKPPWMDVSCCPRIYVYIFFDMNHFFRVLMEKISRKVDMAKIDQYSNVGSLNIKDGLEDRKWNVLLMYEPPYPRPIEISIGIVFAQGAKLEREH